VKKIRVLIVDDSSVVRTTLQNALVNEDDIEVIGTAPEPFTARDMIVNLKPDVITLDIEMPKMDGITFLRKIMKFVPTPVIIISSLTQKNSELALKAFEYGAVEVVAKPGSSFELGPLARELSDKIRAASTVSMRVLTKKLNQEKAPSLSLANVDTTHKLIVIGASTGGTRAIEEVLRPLPRGLPGIVVVQHMPPVFTQSFAQSLNRVCSLEVKEAENLESVLPGYVYIAPGGFHLVLSRSGADYQIQLRSGPQINYQKPAVDVLFKSAAKLAGKNCMGILLTGMGSDGALGLLQMKNAGSFTIAQDEASSVVYGMPGAAVKLNAAVKVLELQAISEAILGFSQNKSKL